MAIKAQNQVTILDITDSYSVILSNENQTFREVAYNSGTAAQTVETTVYSYRGSTNVYSYFVPDPNVSQGKHYLNADGVWLSIESPHTNPDQDLIVTIHIPQGLVNSGSITIPIELYETSTTSGDPLATFNQDFSYSVARYGNTGAQGDSPIIYELDTTGVLFNYDNTTQAYVSPQTITISAKSQTGDTAATKYNAGILRITPYQSNGTAGTVTLVNLATAINHEYALSPNSTYLYYIIELNIGGTISETTITGGTIVDKQTISTCIQGANGENAYSIDITSNNGFVFKNTAISTTLTAHVYSGGTEITTLSDLHSLGLTINWYEDSSSTPVTTNSLTKQYSSYNISDLLTVTAKLEDYTS